METITHNGTYTIESPKGGHKTFRIKTAKNGGLKGKRILSLLVGPDNTADYNGFATLDDNATAFRVWRKFENGDMPFYAFMLAEMILKGDESRYVARGYRLLQSTVCRVCNRKLTTPESVKSGIGPDCAGRRR
jgi:hypothetical protein